MKEAIAKITADFCHAMTARRSIYFLIYSDVDKRTGETLILCKSNSTGAGVSAILAPMLEPTESAMQMLVKALPRPGWFASKKKREAQARALLDRLRFMFVLSKLDAKPIEKPKPVIV